MGTTFIDTCNRRWDLSITVGTVKRVRQLCGVDLYDALGGAVLSELAADPVKLVDVLYAIAKPQADAADVTDEAFGESMAGDAILHATNALLEGLTSFFARPGQREAFRAVLEKLDQVQEGAERVVLERARAIDAAEIVREIEQSLPSLESSSKPSTEPPASAGSTQTPSPPAS